MRQTFTSTILLCLTSTHGKRVLRQADEVIASVSAEAPETPGPQPVVETDCKDTSMCTKWIEEMKLECSGQIEISCPVSCNACDKREEQKNAETQTRNRECKDEIDQCSSLALSLNACKNIDLRNKCRQSCGLCQLDDLNAMVSTGNNMVDMLCKDNSDPAVCLQLKNKNMCDEPLSTMNCARTCGACTKISNFLSSESTPVATETPVITETPAPATEATLKSETPEPKTDAPSSKAPVVVETPAKPKEPETPVTEKVATSAKNEVEQPSSSPAESVKAEDETTAAEVTTSSETAAPSSGSMIRVTLATILFSAVLIV